MLSNRDDAQALPVTSSSMTCCRGWRITRMVIGGIVLTVILALGFLAGRYSQDADNRESAAADWMASLPPIDASASAFSENFSIATGPVSDRAEGLFVLDHNSGLLQCNVIYPRLGRFMASFSTNVGDALGTAGKGGTFIMVTGSASFQGSASNQLAPSVLYVLDTATGNYACYGVPFNRAAQNQRAPQNGTLILIAKGGASMVPDRDRLR